MSIPRETSSTHALSSDPLAGSSSDVEEATLIRLLRSWGITYLTGGLSLPPVPVVLTDYMPPSALLVRLARCPNARVRDATIALLLLRPEVAEAIPGALEQSAPQETEQIAVLTLATLYLQRLWWDRLTLALGHPPAVPEAPFTALWHMRHLPSPAAFCGRWGLLALERAEQRRTGLPLAFTGDWQNQLHHLLLQEEAKHRSAPEGFLLAASRDDWCRDCPEERVLDMSLRPDVDRQAIDHFLTELGRRFHQGGRVYLVGGAALVHAGIRPGSSATTQDIDLEVASGDMYQTIHQLKQHLNINVEFASPGDFLPLPQNWQSMSRYVGRYGAVEVFYFDFYSIALSKIARGNSRDLQDVILLLQQQVISLAELDRAAHEVAAQMGKGNYKRLDPNDFLTRYQAIRQHLP